MTIFKRSSSLFRYHWLAVVGAVVFGCVILAPFVFFELQLGAEYRGIMPHLSDDDLFYMARMHDVADGYPFLSNAYLREHKNGLPQQVFLAEYLLAQPARIFDISLVRLQEVYDFILPVAAFLLTYLLGWLMTRSRFWSLMAAIGLLLGLFTADFLRPISPQFNFVWWLSELVFLWLIVQRPRLLWAIAGGVNLGLLFYIYPFYWMHFGVVISLLVVILFVAGFRKASAYAVVVLGIAGLLAIPYVIITYHASKLSYYQETLSRLQLVTSHFPSSLTVVAACGISFLIVGAAARYGICDRRSGIFFGAALAGLIIASNQQIITGKLLEFSSHYYMPAMFLGVFTLAYCMSRSRLALGNRKSVYMLIGITIAFLVAHNFYRNSHFIISISDEDRSVQEYRVVFDILKQITPSDSVIYADDQLSAYIAAYTSYDVFYTRNANLFLISDAEVEDRFILNNFFENFTPAFIAEHERAIFGVRYVDRYSHIMQGNKLRRLIGLRMLPEDRLPTQEIQRIINKARVIQSGDFLKQAKKYRLDYIVEDKQNDSAWKNIARLRLKKVWEDQRFVIYKI